ncbi:MAG: trypsin-like serine protease [Bdellovibrio sp.]
MRKWGLLLLASAFIAGCGVDQKTFLENTTDDSGIIGGKAVAANTALANSTVALFDLVQGTLCSGTIVGPHLVLTAAHCVNPSTIDGLRVVFSTNVDKGLSTAVVVRAAMIHPGYDPERYGDTADIALVRFQGSLPKGYTPAPLLTDFLSLNEGTDVTVAGYGLNWSWVVSRGSGILRFTSLQVEKLNFSTSELSLSQSAVHSVCSGDSGGPAYILYQGRLHVVGVASRVGSSAKWLMPKCFDIAIYTRVDFYRDWISSASLELLQ